MDHFVITVNNLDKAKDFYHRIIRLKIVNQQSNQDFVTMMCGGHSLLRLRKSTNEVIQLWRSIYRLVVLIFV